MSSFIPEEIISQIRSKTDILDILSGYIQPVKAGNRYKALCPFHQEKTPSFIISQENQTYHCFGCGKGGNIFTFIMEKENLSFPESVRFLAQKCGIAVPENMSGGDTRDYQKNLAQKERLLTIHKTISKWYTERLFKPEGARGLDYLRKRKIPDELIYKFGLGFSPDSWDSALKYLTSLNYSKEDLVLSGLVKEGQEGKLYDHFRNRIVFPIWDEYGEIIAFSCRTILAETKEGKYVNSPETPIFKKSRVLYGLALAKSDIKHMGHAILCEGQIDVISMHRAGFTNAVAPQGTAFTDEQAHILKRFTTEIHICFDGDSAGINATLKALDILLPLEFDIKIIELPPGEDPDSIFSKEGKEGLSKYVKNPHDFLDFIFAQMAKDKDISSPVVKSQIASKILEKLSKIQNKILQTTYISIASEKLGIPRNIALDEVRKLTHHSTMTSSSTAIHQQPVKIQRNNSLTNKAEEMLLELAIRNGNTGRLLDTELPHDMISDTPIGKALNMAISMTINDEWENIPEKLSMFLIENPDSTVSMILSKDKKDYEKMNFDKAAKDCLRMIKIERKKEKKEIYTKELKTADEESREQLIQQINSLQKEILELQKA